MQSIFLSKLKSNIRKSGFHASKVLNPHKHWRVLLWVFSGVVILLIAFSLYLLYQIKNEYIFQVTTSSNETPILLKEKLMKNVIEVFELKADKENSLKLNPPSYIDPSI